MILQKECANIVDFDIYFPFDPDWKNINSIRVSILNCISVLFDDYNKGNAVAMVCAELLENAVKYSIKDVNEPNVYCKLTGNEKDVTIKVSNVLNTSQQRLKRFFETVDFLNNCEDTRKAYTDKLVRMYNDADDAKINGGIGLYRIVYEGGFALGYHIKDDKIDIIAKRSFSA